MRSFADRGAGTRVVRIVALGAGPRLRDVADSDSAYGQSQLAGSQDDPARDLTIPQLIERLVHLGKRAHLHLAA